jgi:hypothetical protein
MRRSLIFASLSLALALLWACGQDSTPDSSSGPQTLSSDAKRCLDVKMGQFADLKAVRSGFDQAVQGCGITAGERAEYLAYTNVLAGVAPDSVGDDTLSELHSVIDVGSFRRGVIQELFTNSWVIVKWDGDAFTSTVKESDIAAEVRSRGGMVRGVPVVETASRRKGMTEEVFANGVALIQWSDRDYTSMERVTGLSPRVDCLNLCTMADVIHNTSLRRGYLTAIYANGMASVRWDGDGQDTDINLSDVSGRVGN